MSNMKKQKKHKDPKIWVLVDDRVGTANQAIDLAEELGVGFEIQRIEYNFFVNLPNFLLSLFPIYIKKAILTQLKQKKLPDLIISSGRRPAALALYLKKLSEGKTKVIQIMRPNLKPQDFEMIILPQHDSFNYALPNVVRILGALTNVNRKIVKTLDEFKNKYPEVDKFIAVIIGGSTKNYTLTLDAAKQLESILATVANNHSLPLFISFSRRTPNNVKKYFREKFIWPHIIYDPADQGFNPYPAMLDQAEYVVATTDSISICSEVVGTGKPVYVFCPDDFKLKKHNFFVQQLVDLGIVKRLDSTASYLDKYDYDPLSEVKKVADIIKNKIKF